MADTTFNTDSGRTIDREMLVAYLNTGTAASPVWSAIGTRVADSSESLDWSKNTEQDILGNTFTTLKKPVVTQSFDPIKLDAGDPAYVKLWNLGIKNQDAQELAAQDVLIVHLYAGSSSTPFAERYPSSAIEVTSIGGEGGGVVEIAAEITYGGKRDTGTATKDDATGVVTFTSAAA